MKKIMVVVLALSLILGLGALASAAEGSLKDGGKVSDTIPVKAVVGKYALVNIDAESINFVFEGAATENYKETTTVAVESNCAINLFFEATPLKIDDGDWIEVNYEFGNLFELTTTDTKGEKSVNPLFTQKDKQMYNLSVTAKLAEISSQSASDDYSANITITVFAD